jgi:hypothetical protein
MDTLYDWYFWAWQAALFVLLYSLNEKHWNWAIVMVLVHVGLVLNWYTDLWPYTQVP